MSLRAGVAVREVDVPIGTPLAGFAGRTHASTGVHDPTSIRAVVVSGIGLVTVDVCALHEKTCRAIERASGLETVVVAATHTHSGPSVGCGRVGTHAQDVHDAVVQAALDALRQAANAQVEVVASTAFERGAGVAHDRRHLARTIDPPISGLCLTEVETGRPLAVLASYPCHPVVLDAQNTLVSADYVDALRLRLESATQAPCLFLTGAAGDVNTGHAASASFSAGTSSARTFARADEIGQQLADVLLRGSWRDVVSGPVCASSRTVQLRFEQLAQAAVTTRRRAWEAQLAQADPGQRRVLDLWIAWANGWTPNPRSATWEGRITAIDLGGITIVCLPGEPFLVAAETITRAHPDVIVAGYCDGVPGYLPDAPAYDAGGYEVDDACMYYDMPAPFARGSLETVTDAALALLERH